MIEKLGPITDVKDDRLLRAMLRLRAKINEAIDNLAPAVEGVTNGDDHDHIDGDGAPITEGALLLSDVVTGDLSISKHGFCPKAPNDSSKFLRGDASWAAGPFYPEVSAVKSSSQETNSSDTVFEPIDGFSFSLTSGRYYRFRFYFRWQTAETVRGMKIKFTTAPASITTGMWGIEMQREAGGYAGKYFGMSIDFTATQACDQAHVQNQDLWGLIEGWVVPGANGTLQPGFASEYNGVQMTVQAGGLGILEDYGAL